jgi:hypothetical protein
MDAVARQGLPLRATELEKYTSLSALTRLLLDILSGPSPTRASDAAQRAHELFDRSMLSNPPPQSPACRKGCSFCCRIHVTATAPEIFAIVRAMHALDGKLLARMQARIRTASAATARDWSRDAFFTYQCPLLEDNACAVHHARPDSCRGLSSYSAQACEISLAAIAEGRDEAIPLVEEHAILRGLHAHTLWAALKAVGLPYVTYSLNQALDRALDTPDAEARWLAGEDVFAGVPQDTSLEGQSLAIVNATMDALIAGATGRPPLS